MAEELNKSMAAGPSRQGYWSELGIEEKVERMRGEVKSLQSQNEFILRKMDELFEHLHHDGKLVIPIKTYIHTGRQSSSGKGDVYF